jgi:hypothetical protein
LHRYSMKISFFLCISICFPSLLSSYTHKVS